MGKEYREGCVSGDIPVCFTVGHSDHEIHHLIALLKIYLIGLVVDVRSSPYSRYARQFNREPLKKSLETSGFRYHWCGDRLSGKSLPAGMPGDTGTPVGGAEGPPPRFSEAIGKTAACTREGTRICLLCAEKDPAGCHRALLIAPCLEDLGIPVYHILADGSLLPHRDLARKAGSVQQKLDIG